MDLPQYKWQAVNDEAGMLAGLPNLPLRYVQKRGTLVRSTGDKCHKYPPLFDILFSNTFWQVFHSSNGSYYLYSAFYDNRSPNKPYIRILGMFNRIQPTVEVFCKIWYDGLTVPVISKLTKYNYIWRKEWGNYKDNVLQPYLMGCIVPDDERIDGDQVPLSVSLVEQPCHTPTNNLRIIYNKQADDEQEENFAVCVKGLELMYVDNSFRITEWLELLFILGADKVFIYDLGVHPNVSKVLKYYESQGRVHIQKSTLPGEQPTAPGLQHLYLKQKITNKRLNEVICYNDCLYNNMYRYKFVVLLDTDEVIMPRSAPNWGTLFQQEKIMDVSSSGDDGLITFNRSVSSYCARHVYFLDSMTDESHWSPEIPAFMHMLQHVNRTIIYAQPLYYTKCFHDTKQVLTLHNHFPITCVGSGRCYCPEIPLIKAHLQHYRTECVAELKAKCHYYKSQVVRDDNIWRFKKPLIDNTLHTLRHLGLL